MSIKEDRINSVEKDFVMQAKTAFGDNLKSIILYGSILTENYNPLSSDINLLIILNQADPERIVVLGKYAAKTGTLAIALFPVWLCNGFWHGPRWSYIFYGMYYFAVLLLTAMFDPFRDRMLKRFHIRKEAVWYKAIRMIKTWAIIIVGELFFRAAGLRNGMRMFCRMLQDFSLEQLDNFELVERRVIDWIGE